MFGESKYWELQKQLNELKKELERKEYWMNKQGELLEALLVHLNLEKGQSKTIVFTKKGK